MSLNSDWKSGVIGTEWIRPISSGLALVITLSLSTAVATAGLRDRGARSSRSGAGRSAGGCVRWDSHTDGCELARQFFIGAERQAASAVTAASVLLVPTDDTADSLCITADLLAVELEPTDFVRVVRSTRCETAPPRLARGRAPPSDA